MTDFRSKIKKATDMIEVKSIVVLLFGDPGLGKTSLGFTAESPLHIDYDRGIKRSVGRKDSLQLTSWQDGIDLLESNYIEEERIKSLVFDTVGTMLDNFATMFLIAESAKNGKPGGGLSLQGYGALKEKFKVLKNLAESKGVNLIFLCQVKEEKDGDSVKKIPNVTGGSYDIVKAAADLIGYMEIVNGKRTLDFNSTDRHDGKNSPEFPLLTLPHYTDPAWENYLAKIISDTINHMNRKSEAQQKALDTIKEFQEKIAAAESSSQLLDMIPLLEELPKQLNVQLRKVLDEKFVQLWTTEFIESINDKEGLTQLITTINEMSEERYKKPLKVKLLSHADKCGYVILNKEPIFRDKPKPETKEEKPAETTPSETKEVKQEVEAAK